MPKWWRPVALGSAGVSCVVVSTRDEGPPAPPGECRAVECRAGEEGARRARRMKGGRAGSGVVVGSPWRLAGTTLSVAEATRVGPALGIYSVSRVNPIFIDEDFTPVGPSQRSHYPNAFQNAAPESPGKSGSSGYESNPCSDESPVRRGDPRHIRNSAPRRAAASRSARRQACSVHRQTIRQGTADGRAHEGDSDEGYARLPLAPIPEGRVGAPLRALSVGDLSGRGASESAGDSPASYSPASTASSSPASSSSSSSGKRLLKSADAAILLWGQGPSRGAAASDAGAGEDPGGGGRGLLRGTLKASSCPSPLSSASSTVSSGATLPPHRGTVLPEDEGVAEGDGDVGKAPQDRSADITEDPRTEVEKVLPPPEEPPDGDRSPPKSPASPGGVARCAFKAPAFESSWGGFLFPPQFVRRGADPEEGGVPNALKNAMLYGTLYRIKAGVDAYEKLKALEREGPAASRDHEDVMGRGEDMRRVPWGGWDFGGGPVLGKELGASGKLQAPHSPVPSIASSQGKQFTGHGHADFTLDMPRAERLMRQIAAAKRRRCWGRFLATTFALVFFFISVVAVSMLCTRGKRVFGPL